MDRADWCSKEEGQAEQCKGALHPEGALCCGRDQTEPPSQTDLAWQVLGLRALRMLFWVERSSLNACLWARSSSVYLEVTVQLGERCRDEKAAESTRGWYFADLREECLHEERCVHEMDNASVRPHVPVSQLFDPLYAGTRR